LILNLNGGQKRRGGGELRPTLLLMGELCSSKLLSRLVAKLTGEKGDGNTERVR